MSADQVAELMQSAGITKDDPDYGLQYNLCHASLGELGIRNGLDGRIEAVLRKRGLGGGEDGVLERFMIALMGMGQGR